MSTAPNITPQDDLKRQAPNRNELVPPYDEGAEAGALGCILNIGPSDPSEARRRLSLLSPDFFHDVRHWLILEALNEICKGGKVIEVVSLRECLMNRGKYEQAGGDQYVPDLPNPTNAAIGLFETYVERLKEQWSRREALEYSKKIQKLALDPRSEFSVEMLADAVDFGDRIAKAGSADNWETALSKSAVTAQAL